MTKDEIIGIMTETVHQINMDIGYEHRVPHDELVAMLEAQRPQLDHINNIVYEVLKSKGAFA
jgi:hypothetical protein